MFNNVHIPVDTVINDYKEDITWPRGDTKFICE